MVDPLEGHQQIARFHVTVDDAKGLSLQTHLLVRVGETGCGVQDDLECKRNCERRAVQLADLAHGATVQVLHGDEPRALVLADLEDVDDVGVTQVGCCPRFVQEHAYETLFLGQMRKDALEDDELLEAFQARLPSQEHLAHPTGRQRTQ